MNSIIIDGYLGQNVGAMQMPNQMVVSQRGASNQTISTNWSTPELASGVMMAPGVVDANVGGMNMMVAGGSVAGPGSLAAQGAQPHNMGADSTSPSYVAARPALAAAIAAAAAASGQK